ncbi:MAG: phosphoribosylanthranilate isomerase [Caulobacteraceae bacterium]
MAKAKICGLTTAEAVDAALAGGAAYLGFMFFAASPRNVAPEAAARLAEQARGKAKIVAVLVDPSDALVDRLAAILRPDLLQLHGKESPERVLAIARRARAGAIKAIAVREPHDLDAAGSFETVSQHLMFDAAVPESAGRPGGGGERFDWRSLAGRRFERPWFLAGGLDPWNVQTALAETGAPLVDVSTGVERGPGLKDPALIRAFLEAVGRF